MSISSIPRFAFLTLTLAPTLVAGGQSSIAVSPFVSYVPSASSNPLAGFALTFGGTTGLALRSSGEISISNPDSSAVIGHYRPWGADADAMLFFGGLGGGATVFSRALSPYVFSGIGLTGGDSAGRNSVSDGWSYGAGATIPLGLHAGLFAEARWRMSQYVLPTAENAPDSRSALRFGLSFHVGGAESSEPRRGPRRRSRMDSYDEEDEYAVAPAPAPAPQVVVVQPAPPPPQVVIVNQQPERRRPAVSINVPIIIYRSQRAPRVYVTGSHCSRSRRGSHCSLRRYGFDLRAAEVATRPIEVKMLPLPRSEKLDRARRKRP